MKHDLLADTFSVMKNMESIGRKECFTPASKTIKEILKVMQKHKYIGDFEYMDDGRGGKFRIKLLGKINDCNVIKPRHSIRKREVFDWERRFLPAANVGILILTTPQGVMDQREAGKQNTGGKLLGYVY
jgi:small subunit ribosomal protein S8